MLIAAIWVGDLFVGAREREVALESRNTMSRTFDMKDEEECSYSLGMNIEQSDGGFLIHPPRFAKQVLQRFSVQRITHAKALEYPQTLPSITPSHERMVIFDKLFNLTRPYIAFEVGYVVRYNANQGQTRMNVATRTFSHVKVTPDYSLWYPRSSGSESLLAMSKAFNPLAGMADSDFVGCVDTRKPISR